MFREALTFDDVLLEGLQGGGSAEHCLSQKVAFVNALDLYCSSYVYVEAVHDRFVC